MWGVPQASVRQRQMNRKHSYLSSPSGFRIIGQCNQHSLTGRYFSGTNIRHCIPQLVLTSQIYRFYCLYWVHVVRAVGLWSIILRHCSTIQLWYCQAQEFVPHVASLAADLSAYLFFLRNETNPLDFNRPEWSGYMRVKITVSWSNWFPLNIKITSNRYH